MAEQSMPLRARQEFDPGLTQRYTGRLRRVINKDGSFNVRKRGVGWRETGVFLHLLNSGWLWFLTQAWMAYVVLNLGFAGVYYAIGVESLTGADRSTPLDSFLSAFFFSVQTFTTVGYGHVSPKGMLTSTVASFEAMMGLLSFAIGTGLVYARFSRPSAKLAFSEKMVVAPFNDGRALMFRIANRRPNVLMESEATAILMTVDKAGEHKRKYQPLKLDRERILFLPLTWTIVHSIDESSPLWGLDTEQLESLQAEFLILIKVFDDTFGQPVHARYSYTWDEIEWGRKFEQVFTVNADGDLELDLSDLGKTMPA
ncbi:MAG: K+ channel, inward rectifier [Acidobacteria bacterium]|nr:K+ channel, inward rectifier [Acidobacteriota bacterium]